MLNAHVNVFQHVTTAVKKYQQSVFYCELLPFQFKLHSDLFFLHKKNLQLNVITERTVYLIVLLALLPALFLFSISHLLYPSIN